MTREFKLPKIVYKYRSWTNLKQRRTLTHNELFISSPKDFNDPFDCKIPINFVSLDTPEKRAAYVDLMTKTHFAQLNNAGRDIPKEMERLERELNNDIWAVQRDRESKWFQFHDERFGVLSLSIRWDSILMWSHYANNHQGFCIGYHEEKLRTGNEFGFGRSQYVNYIRKDEMPFIDPMEVDHLKRIFIESGTKAYDWKYEKEYRLHKTFFDGAPTPTERKIWVNDDCIAEVVIGLRINPKHREKIVRICKKKGIKVFQVEQVPFRFKLKRKRINPLL
jgi:hypothetical protein